MKKESVSEYFIDIDFGTEVMENKVLTFIYDGGEPSVIFEENFITLYIRRYNPNIDQFGKN